MKYLLLIPIILLVSCSGADNTGRVKSNGTTIQFHSPAKYVQGDEVMLVREGDVLTNWSVCNGCPIVQDTLIHRKGQADIQYVRVIVTHSEEVK